MDSSYHQPVPSGDQQMAGILCNCPIDHTMVKYTGHSMSISEDESGRETVCGMALLM